MLSDIARHPGMAAMIHSIPDVLACTTNTAATAVPWLPFVQIALPLHGLFAYTGVLARTGIGG
ncbi:MAG: hypothetical protein GY886_05970 [Gammaproteobacteria bacterium]|nr:hypothetical protein [Gammaproteobacteria bacterium]